MIKAAAVEPSSAPAEEDPHLPILLYLDWYLFSTLLRVFTRKIYIYFPFPYFVSVAQLAVGVTLCIVNSSLGSNERAPINKDLLAVITPTAVLHTIVHLVYNNFLNSEVVRRVPFKDKVLAPFYTTVGSWILRRQDFFVSLWVALAFTVIGAIMSLTSRNFYLKEAMKRMDSTNVYTYVTIISLLFCIPFALHMEGPKVQYQLSRAIAKSGMGTILYDFSMLGTLYYRCNKVATESLRRIHPVIFTAGILFEYVCATSYSK
nr:hypothetical protein [Tanacetum cinerariifolium]